MAALAERWQRAFEIEPGEGRVLATGAVALFLIEWASVSVTNVSETFFLKRIGVERLPLVFLVNSILLAGTSVAVGRIAARSDQRRLLGRVLLVFGFLLLPLWALVIARVTSAFAVLVVVAKQIDAIAVLVFWTVLGGLVTARQGKRLFGLMTAGGTLGTICGSFASAPLAHAFGIPTLLPIAAALLGLGALATRPLRQRQPVRARRAARREDTAHRRFWVLWRGWLFRVLVVSSLLAGVLGPMLYFEFSYVADLATRGATGEQRLLDLYAVIRGWINVGVLALQVLGTSALFRWLGVPLAAAVSPVIYLLGLAGLCLRTSLPAGVGAMAGATLQDHAVYDPAQRILLTLFPEHVRATVTALVDGAAKRVGAVAGNLVVIAILGVGSAAWVGWIGLPVAVLWLVLALMLWWQYPTLLLEVAAAEHGGAGSPKPLAVLLDTSTLRGIGKSLESPDLARCRAACALVAEAPPTRAVATLARALGAAPPANRRLLITALDRILEGTTLRSKSAADAVAALLTAPDGLDTIDRANLVQAFARLLGPAAGEPERRRVLDTAAGDEREAVRLAAVAALCRLERRSDLEDLLASALESEDAATRQIVREELRAELLRRDAEPASADALRHLRRLAARLDHPDDRPHAALALADVAERYGARVSALGPALLAHRDDHDVRVRTAVLRFVGASGVAEEARWAAGRLAAPDAGEAAAAQEALRALGPAAVGALCETLRFGRLAARARALPILREMPEEEQALQGLVDREVEASLRLLVQGEALRAGGAADIVLRRLRERVDENAHTALLLLAAALDDERIGRASELLRSTTSSRERAVLLEALEAVLPAEDAERLLPLLERESPHAIAARAGRLLGSAPPSFDDAARALATDGDALTAALLHGTLDAETRARLQLDGNHGSVPYGTNAPAMAPDIETLLHLRSLDLFERLTTQQLADLAAAVEKVTFPAGAPIVTEGDLTDGLYVIVEGDVLVTKAGIPIRTLKPGEFFGEMAILDGEMRAASATAVGTVRLLRLSRDAVLQTMETQPAIAIAICQTLSRRLRDLLDDRARLEPKG
ncbi:MAG TPA: cyclic nucleotide-binding domain-containing protein [Candidatus Eisenbacteria bacterium]|nr:cyclic nucleotide-binding domain-containing protein [Candidatus Eisenbacteria bacterium]